MSALTPASEVLLRHSDDFACRHILFAGDLQDSLPWQLLAASKRVHTQQLHHWQMLHPLLGDNVRYQLLADKQTVSGVDTLIYYWPKNKPEARFQLMNLLSLLEPGSDIFVTGENRAGVRSTVQMLEGFCPLHKIDSARRCGLYHGQLMHQADFSLADYWDSYRYNDITIKTLPGVFSRDGLDAGSQLLISTFSEKLRGKILDMGCGAGVLAAALARLGSPMQLTLCDVSAAALEASKATLQASGISASVLASNVFSDISGRFDAIIANPPFHEGLQTSLQAARQLICQAPDYLQPGGELRIVANRFLPYSELLDEAFGHHQVLAQSSRFKVCQAIMPPGSGR